MLAEPTIVAELVLIWDSGDKSKRVPTIAFVQGNRDSEEITLATDPHKIAIRFGDFYAKKLIAILWGSERSRPGELCAL